MKKTYLQWAKYSKFSNEYFLKMHQQINDEMVERFDCPITFEDFTYIKDHFMRIIVDFNFNESLYQHIIQKILVLKHVDRQIKTPYGVVREIHRLCEYYESLLSKPKPFKLSVKNSEHEFVCNITNQQAKEINQIGLNAFPLLKVVIKNDFNHVTNKPLANYSIEILKTGNHE